jgi:hypothetical protein
MIQVHYSPVLGNMYDDDTLEKWYYEAVVKEGRSVLMVGNWFTVARILMGIKSGEVKYTDIEVHWIGSDNKPVVSHSDRNGKLDRVPDEAERAAAIGRFL